MDINIPNINTVEIENNKYPSENYESLSWSSEIFRCNIRCKYSSGIIDMKIHEI